MYYIIEKKILQYFNLNNGKNKKKEKFLSLVIEYFFPVLISVTIASAIGYTLQIEVPAMIFSIFYSLQKTSGGGNYMKFNLKSSATFWAFGIIILKASEYIMAELYFQEIAALLLFASFLIAITMTPMKIDRMSTSENMKKGLKKRNFIAVSLFTVCLGAGMLILKNNWTTAGIIGMFAQSLSTLQTPLSKAQMVEFETYVM